MSVVKNSPKGTILVLLSTIMFGSYGVWSKLIGNSMGTFYQGWTRGLILSLILLPVLIIKKEIIPIEKKDFKWVFIFLLFTSLTQAPIFYAFTHMDIGSASLLFFVTVLLTMYSIGILFLKERFTKIKIVSFVIAVIGLCTLFSFSIQKFSMFAAGMAILNGIASGGEVSFSKKLTGSYSPLYISFLSWAIILPTNMFLSIIFGEKQLLPSLTTPWLWQISYTLVSLFAFWFVIYGLSYIEASIGGLLGLLEVIFSILFGILLFGETITVKLLVGSFLILTAAALPHIANLNKKKVITN